MEVEFKELIGKTLVEIRDAKKGDDEIIFITSVGEEYKMYHNQDCCESVFIEDVNGDILDLLNNPILVAEEVISGDNPEGVQIEYQDSFTWTFYKIATVKGYVTIRWYGESNGYYSESVDFVKADENGDFSRW